MKKRLFWLLLIAIALIAPAVFACGPSYPVGSSGNTYMPPPYYIWKITASGSVWQVTSGVVGDLANSTTTSIDFGASSGLSFTADWQTTGHLKNLSFSANVNGINTVNINGNPQIYITGGGLIGSPEAYGGTIGGVTKITGLGPGPGASHEALQICGPKDGVMTCYTVGVGIVCP